MQKIGFATSSERTTYKPEKLGSIIEKIDHELPIIC